MTRSSSSSPSVGPYTRACIYTRGGKEYQGTRDMRNMRVMTTTAAFFFLFFTVYTRRDLFFFFRFYAVSLPLFECLHFASARGSFARCEFLFVIVVSWKRSLFRVTLREKYCVKRSFFQFAS